MQDDSRRLATNHLGWQVEVMTKEWRPIYREPFLDSNTANIVAEILREEFPDYEFRVYEEVAKKLRSGEVVVC